jgi:hypothetical protein
VRERAAINMRENADKKKENKQTNVSLICYSQEWPFLKKVVIFIYYGLCSLYL